MAENHEIAVFPSTNDKSADRDIDDILLESDSVQQNQWQWWHVAPPVAVAAGLVYIVYAAWQWQKKGDAVASQLVQQKENVDTVSLMISLNEQNMQGMGTFYMAIIIGLVVFGICWFGLTKSSDFDKARKKENAIRIQSVVAKKEKKTLQLLHKTEVEGYSQLVKGQKDQIKSLETSCQAQSEELKKVSEEKSKVDKELGAKEAALEKTEEKVKRQSAEMEQLRTVFDQEKTEKQELKIELAEEKVSRQKTEESLRQEKSEKENLKEKVEIERQDKQKLEKDWTEKMQNVEKEHAEQEKDLSTKLEEEKAQKLVTQAELHTVKSRLEQERTMIETKNTGKTI